MTETRTEEPLAAESIQTSETMSSSSIELPIVPRSSSPGLAPVNQTTSSTPFRQNQVSTTQLYGVRIVSLLIDGKERLCLAQISNTLLKNYSYNEIHNRRVALGITCVQCTPVQLEILRRAGAMPISSRRCGMISKREAERLVKSFLEDSTPPKLPENFAFDVKHACGWGCRGSFIPSRYNSSRAKCLKCYYCNMFFSPNKFIFHFHRMPDSKYQHPDAANFNSWRRHLKLHDPKASEELMHAWEDVKAMFNGGNRKRVVTGVNCTKLSPPSPEIPCKRPKLDVRRERNTGPNSMSTGAIPPQVPYPYPMFPVPNKLYPMKSAQAHPAFPLPFPYEKPPLPVMTAPDSEGIRPSPHSPNAPWISTSETMYPPYEMIWAKHLGLSNTESNYATNAFQNPSKQSPKQLSPYQAPFKQAVGAINLGAPLNLVNPTPGEEYLDHQSPADHAMLSNRHEHFSAFRPLATKSLSPTRIELSPTLSNADTDGSMRSSPQEQTVNENSGRSLREEEEIGSDADSDCENVDVDTIDDEGECEENNNLDRKENASDTRSHPVPADSLSHRDKQDSDSEDTDTVTEPTSITSDQERTQVEGDLSISKTDEDTDGYSEDQRTSAPNTNTTEQEVDLTTKEENANSDDSGLADEKENVNLKESGNLFYLSKDELHKELLSQLQTRRRLEQDCKVIKDTFEEQVKREQHYREEMTKQLQIVRETLCRELDQERKARFNLQQKLKEAHDAIHNFSCKLLASRECNGCPSYREPMIPR